MRKEWATTWYNLISESEQLMEAIGEGGLECFTPNQLKSMNIKSIQLEQKADSIKKSWNQNRTDEIWDVAVELDRIINPTKIINQ